MNMQTLLDQLDLPTSVVAFCNIVSSDELYMSMTTCDFKMDCQNCHILKSPRYSEKVTSKGFVEKITTIKDLTCVLFFDAYPYENTSSTEEDLYKFLKIANELDVINVCLYSKRKELPSEMKKLLVAAKIGA